LFRSVVKFGPEASKELTVQGLRTGGHRGWVSLKSRRLSISAVLGLYSLTGIELQDATRLTVLAYILNFLCWNPSSSVNCAVAVRVAVARGKAAAVTLAANALSVQVASTAITHRNHK